MSPANGKRTHITVRLDDELTQRIVKSAEQVEQRSVSDFIRHLIKWAMLHYEHHGTLTDLYRNLPATKKGR